MRQTHPEPLTHDLAGSRSAEKLAAPSRTRTGTARGRRRFSKADLTMGIACAQRLHLSQIFRVLTKETDTPRHENTRQVATARQRHHHSREPLITGRDAHDSLRRWK